MPWVVGRDFNEIFETHEKTGSERATRQISYFRNTVDDYGLVDLGFEGYCFTWNNMRHGENNVQV